MSYSQNLGRIPFDKYYQPSLLSPPTSAPGAIAPSRLPVDELSLERLTAIAAWIRDHLDPRVAREGPEILHPDDVLLLLDVFTALQHVEISASTLRVTRIYKAILEVSGKATRWPGRLADECDKLIILWRHHFGPLKGLRPFLYGRGGRLDGTTNVTDVTKGAVLKRWKETVPDLVAPERSRRHGDLGFQPGDWWLNSLFAYRAGIIDLETCDGGICFDNKGAYAILVRDTDEIDGKSPSAFTYRCRKGNAGRFRLTAADFKSRAAIRILRSHNLTSLWAPRAGVRYEGLHRILGWTIRPATDVEAAKTDFLVGELIVEVKFQRETEGQIPMEKVMQHPLAADVDDYAEFKRLRRLQRENVRHPSPGGILFRDVGLGDDLESRLGYESPLSRDTPLIGDELDLETASGLLIPAGLKCEESMISTHNTHVGSVASPSATSSILRTSFHRPSLSTIQTSFRHPGSPVSFPEDHLSSLNIPNLSHANTAGTSHRSGSPVSSKNNSKRSTHVHTTSNSNPPRRFNAPPSRNSLSSLLHKGDSPAAVYVATTGLPLNEVAPLLDIEILLNQIDLVPTKPIKLQSNQSVASLGSCGSNRSANSLRSALNLTDSSANSDIPMFPTGSLAAVSEPASVAPSDMHSFGKSSGSSAPRKSSVLESPMKKVKSCGNPLQGSTLSNEQRDERRARRKKRKQKKVEDDEKRRDGRQKKGLPRLSLHSLTKKGNLLSRLLDGSVEANLEPNDDDEGAMTPAAEPSCCVLAVEPSDSLVMPQLTSADTVTKRGISTVIDTKTVAFSVVETNSKGAGPLPFGFSPIRQKLSPVTDQEWQRMVDAQSPTSPQILPPLGLRSTGFQDEATSLCALPLPPTHHGSPSSRHVFASILPASSFRNVAPEVHAKDLNADLDRAGVFDTPRQTTYKIEDSDFDRKQERNRSSGDNVDLAHNASQSVKAATDKAVMEALVEFQKIKSWFRSSYGGVEVGAGVDGATSAPNFSVSTPSVTRRDPSLPSNPSSLDKSRISSIPSNSETEHMRTKSISFARSPAVEYNPRKFSQISEASSGDAALQSLLTHTNSQGSKAEEKIEWAALAEWQSRVSTTTPDSENADPDQKRWKYAYHAPGHDLKHKKRNSSQLSRASSGETAHLNLLTHAKTQEFKKNKKEEEWAALKKWQVDEAAEAFEMFVTSAKGRGPLMKETVPEGTDITGKVMFTDPFAQKFEGSGMGLNSGIIKGTVPRRESKTITAVEEEQTRPVKKTSEESATGE